MSNRQLCASRKKLKRTICEHNVRIIRECNQLNEETHGIFDTRRQNLMLFRNCGGSKANGKWMEIGDTIGIDRQALIITTIINHHHGDDSPIKFLVSASFHRPAEHRPATALCQHFVSDFSALLPGYVSI